MDEQKIRKAAKKAAKKAQRKAAAKTKTYMEVSRTVCSFGGLLLGAISLLRVYHFI